MGRFVGLRHVICSIQPRWRSWRYTSLRAVMEAGAADGGASPLTFMWQLTLLNAQNVGDATSWKADGGGEMTLVSLEDGGASECDLHSDAPMRIFTSSFELIALHIAQGSSALPLFSIVRQKMCWKGNKEETTVKMQLKLVFVLILLMF